MENNLEKNYNPKGFEDRIYKHWMDNDYFKAKVNPDKEPFCIVLPPPNITGQLHMGHALDHTLQDILIRWKRMQGYEALWQPGTDHASIATEVKVVEKIRQEEGLSKLDVGREGFLERAWKWKDEYGGRIVDQMKKLGDSCDWSRERFTLDEGLSNAVTEVFIKLYEKGLIYRGNRIINWCPDCKTSLSDAEVEHEEKAGHFWHIKYPIKDSDEFLEIATTRPETMLGDTAIAVHPEDERALNISSKLINCKHRHLVFTIPTQLRNFFRFDRSLLDILFKASSQTILAWFRKLNKSEQFTPGFISTLHTFGRDLKWNPHIHMILTEGASGNNTIWRHFHHIPFTMLRKRWQATLLDLLHKKLGARFYSLKSKLFLSFKDGFYVYAKKEKRSIVKNSVDYIVRYTGKPAMAQSRIINYDGNYVTFYYDRHEDGKRVTEKLSAFDFIKRLIIHIPDEQFKMIRYYGLYAKKYIHSSKLYLLNSLVKINFRRKHSHWRARLLLAFGVDPLCCSCGYKMELIGIFRSGKNLYLDNSPSHLYNSA